MAQAQQFHKISVAEMENFLNDYPGSRKFQRVFPPRTKERVYGKIVGDNLCLRVYTSLDDRNNGARECGSDAIRVVLVYRDPKSGEILKVGGSKRVHRIQTWEKNLRKRIDGWRDTVSQDLCPDCNAPMVTRKGSNGPFLGCITYGVSKCKGTRQLSK